MRKIFVFVLFTLITTLLFSQNNYQDVVYLKNGSIIRGVIVEQTPNKSIKIQTAENNVFVYEMDEIEKMAKEINQRRNLKQGDTFHLEPGYKGITELGYEIGVGDYGYDRIKLNIINGYQVNQSFSLGIGTGLRYYNDLEALLVPIFADFRGNLPLNSKVSPYMSLGIGYSFDATNSFEGVGLMLNPTIGVSFKVSDKSAMNVGLGYEMQKMDFYLFDGSSLFSAGKQNSGAISINIGFSF